jgi:hypothetical protein
MPHKSQTVRNRNRDEKETLKKKFKSDHSSEFNAYLKNVNKLIQAKKNGLDPRTLCNTTEKPVCHPLHRTPS